MILNNYYKWRYEVENFAWPPSSDICTNDDSRKSTSMIDTSGNTTPIQWTSGTYSGSNQYGVNAHYGGYFRTVCRHNSDYLFQFSANTSEITNDIYTLPNAIDNVSRTSFSCNYSGEASKGIITMTAVYKNNNSDPITIKRIGIVRHFTYANGAAYSLSTIDKYVLMAVKDLDAPIVVEPGMSFNVVINWSELESE